MSDTVVWVKPNKQEIKINNDKASEDYAKSLGWTKKKGRKPVEV